MNHTAGFLKVVTEARPYVQELSPEEARQHLADNPEAVLVDVREESEWRAGHAAGAVHLGKGVLERDLERRFPDPGQELLLYCGGGYRSVLAAATARQMGYRNVYSVKGGYQALVQHGWLTAAGE